MRAPICCRRDDSSEASQGGRFPARGSSIPMGPLWIHWDSNRPGHGVFIWGWINSRSVQVHVDIRVLREPLKDFCLLKSHSGFLETTMGSSNTQLDDISIIKTPLEKRASHDEGLPNREALIEALKTQKPSPWSPNLRKLYVFCVIAFLCSSMNGKQVANLAFRLYTDLTLRLWRLYIWFTSSPWLIQRPVWCRKERIQDWLYLSHVHSGGHLFTAIQWACIRSLRTQMGHIRWLCHCGRLYFRVCSCPRRSSVRCGEIFPWIWSQHHSINQLHMVRRGLSTGI